MKEEELTPEELFRPHEEQQRLDEFITRLEHLMHEYPEVSFESDDPYWGVQVVVKKQRNVSGRGRRTMTLKLSLC